jgi:hypothetical protein
MCQVRKTIKASNFNKLLAFIVYDGEGEIPTLTPCC